MRHAAIAAVLVASALAVPFNHEKRDVVTETTYNIIYTTDVVTVTAEPGADPSPKAHFKHKHHWWSSQDTSSSAAAVPTSTAEQPTWGPPATTTVPSTRNAPSPTDTSAPSTPSSAGSSYQDIAVYHHNIHRSNHSAPAIAWDDDLASSAADIAASCVYAHNVDADGGGYGQNIAAGVPSDNISAVITDLFYNGEVNYYSGYYGMAQPPMTNFEHFGHFTQIVWKATTHVGCATQDCSSKGLANTGGDVSPYFTVCNYKSPGNYENEYGDNIGQPQGEPTANWNAGMN